MVKSDSVLTGIFVFVLVAVIVISFAIKSTIHQYKQPYLPPNFRYACEGNACVLAANGPHSSYSDCFDACHVIYCEFNGTSGYTGKCTRDKNSSDHHIFQESSCTPTIQTTCNTHKANQRFTCDSDDGWLPCTAAQTTCNLTADQKDSCVLYSLCDPSKSGYQTCTHATVQPKNSKNDPGCKAGPASRCGTPTPAPNAAIYYNNSDGKCIQKQFHLKDKIPDRWSTDLVTACADATTGICWKGEDSSLIQSSAKLPSDMEYCTAMFTTGACDTTNGWESTKAQGCANVANKAPLQSGWCLDTTTSDSSCKTLCPDPSCFGTPVFQYNLPNGTCVNPTTKAPTSSTVKDTPVALGESCNPSFLPSPQGGWGQCAPSHPGCTCISPSSVPSYPSDSSCDTNQVKVGSFCVDKCMTCEGKPDTSSCDNSFRPKCLASGSDADRIKSASLCQEIGNGVYSCLCHGSENQGDCEPFPGGYPMCGSGGAQCTSPGCIGCAQSKETQQNLRCNVEANYLGTNKIFFGDENPGCNFEFNRDGENNEDIMVCPDGSACIMGNPKRILDDNHIDSSLQTFAENKLYVCQDDVAKGIAKPRSCIHVSALCPKDQSGKCTSTPTYNWCRYYNKMTDRMISNCCLALAANNTSGIGTYCKNNADNCNVGSNVSVL